MAHQAVLLQEVRTLTAPQAGEVVLDATINRGGHARVLAAELGPTGHLVGLDADRGALRAAAHALAGLACPVTLIQGNFRDLAALLAARGISALDIAFFDLGWSAEQLAGSGRGFSFQGDEPLIMTLAADLTPGELTAYEIVNGWREESLVEILRDYGEERFARPIAGAIVAARRQGPIVGTAALVEVIRQALPTWYQRRRLHFATKTFQALRIATNDELGALTAGLEQAWRLLRPGGRLAVISFHSLEARLVKRQFRAWRDAGVALALTSHAIKATRAEQLANPRSRSAQLRVLKKLS
jgi:16S rRNA (cytosine1402-N4)-methyltransferase